MTRWRLVPALLAGVAMAGSANLSAQVKPNFSGTWTLDATRSDALPQRGGGTGGRMGAGGGMGGGRMGAGGGMGGPIAQNLVITQTETELKIETGDRTTAYKLDGSESVNPGPRGEARTRSRWDGLTLVTEGTQAMSGGMGDMTIETKEVRRLSADGTEMTVETTIKTPRGEASRKTVYTKSAT